MEITIKLPKLHPVQQRIDDHHTRYTVVSCGRRVGKTTYILSRIIKAILHGKRVGLWLPTHNYFATVWKNLLRLIPKDLITEKNQSTNTIELITGGHLRIHSAEAATGRGEAYHEVYCDECSVMANLEILWNEVIEPVLSDFDGIAFFLGTPKGKNFFHVLAMKARHDPEWSHFTASTLDNPHLPPRKRKEIEDKPDTPYNRQEYFAVFLDDGGDLFGTLKFVTEIKESESYRIGIDLAKSQDWTVVSIFNEFNQQVYLERWNTMNWDGIVDKIVDICSNYFGADIIVDATGVGASVCDHLEARGLDVTRFVFTEPSRYKILERCALLIDNNEVEFLNDELQTAEFEAFGRYVRHGRVKLLSSAKHDDTVFAACLALSLEPPRQMQVW